MEEERVAVGFIGHHGLDDGQHAGEGGGFDVEGDGIDFRVAGRFAEAVDVVDPIHGGGSLLPCFYEVGVFAVHAAFAKVALAGYFKGIDGVLVAGVGAQEYAKRLGFSQDQIYRGLYAWDESMALRVDRGEVSGRAFLFVGRYVPAKGLDVLLDAYGLYRKRVQQPWDLWCCGAGPMGELIVGREGVVDYGFVQPDDLPSKFSKAEVFVLPSLYEPWGVAIAEAMGCGLPVICTDRCGAGWDLVEEGITGWRIKSGDVEALAAAMQEAHRSKERLRGMGHEAKRAAGGFTADAWGGTHPQDCQRFG